ncbi:hypothetical protein CEXT_280501 [Caerostris extrusa]|uniref:Uncharacterized protein n=1 Tax=Caerostris extrusa TaxID=172846 RepID=A0AAV4NX86_CAEEX|nr:hypothetical protein CEXT_280501 [Caerostris extrusa]
MIKAFHNFLGSFANKGKLIFFPFGVSRRSSPQNIDPRHSATSVMSLAKRHLGTCQILPHNSDLLDPPPADHSRTMVSKIRYAYPKGGWKGNPNMPKAYHNWLLFQVGGGN